MVSRFVAPALVVAAISMAVFFARSQPRGLVQTSAAAEAAPKKETESKSKSGEAKGEKEEKKEDEKPKTVAEVTEGARFHDGFFPIYKKERTGEPLGPLRPNHWGRKYIYFPFTADGVVE